MNQDFRVVEFLDENDVLMYTESYDEVGRLLSRTWRNDPKHPDSFRRYYDDQGKLIQVIYAEDPEDEESFTVRYDSHGNHISNIFKNGAEYFKFNGKACLELSERVVFLEEVVKDFIQYSTDDSLAFVSSYCPAVKKAMDEFRG